jgi:hypothetical protein
MIIVPEFQCEEGWRGIINKSIREIDEIVGKEYFVFEQIKEKLGGLRIYYRFDPNLINSDKIQEIVRKAEAEASVTCEITGKPGSLCRRYGGWLKTLCPEKAKELGFLILDLENQDNKI